MPVWADGHCLHLIFNPQLEGAVTLHILNPISYYTA